MKDHEAYERLLAVRPDVSEEEEGVLGAHLAHCASCRNLEAAYRDQDALLQPLQHVSPPTSFRASLLSHAEKPTRARKSIAPFSKARMGAGLAAAVVVLVSAGIVSRAGHWSQSTQQHALARCDITGQGWRVVGPCRVLASPEHFRGPNIVFYTGSLRWVSANLMHPSYVMRPGTAMPAILTADRPPAAFSKVAATADRSIALYALGQIGGRHSHKSGWVRT